MAAVRDDHEAKNVGSTDNAGQHTLVGFDWK
jgi:hypothetical protein